MKGNHPYKPKVSREQKNLSLKIKKNPKEHTIYTHTELEPLQRTDPLKANTSYYN